MKVLIAEDNANLADVVSMGLSMEGIQTRVAYDGRDAMEELDSCDYDMLILDRDLPGVHGDEIARRLSGRHDPVHILMLTAADTTEDVVQGLELGADDYVTKPFDYAVLLARVNAVRRRKELCDDVVIQKGEFQANFHTGVITVEGRRLRFGQRELAVLKTLIQAQGGVVGADRLYKEVWKDDHARTRGIVKTTVYSIRNKIGLPGFIETIPGQGYRIP